MDKLTGFFTGDGSRLCFRFGKDDYASAAACAAACGGFAWDDDEECVDDSSISCYNCRYRRWSQNSFSCMRRHDI